MTNKDKQDQTGPIIDTHSTYPNQKEAWYVMRRNIHMVKCMVMCMVASVLIASGCGEESPPAEVEAGFTTPDALLERINQLITSNPYDQEGMLSLLFLENDLQQRLARLERDVFAYNRLQHLAWNRFGVGIPPNQVRSPLAPLPPAHFVERSEHRAVAVTRGAADEPRELHLVKIGDHWHLSGYTLERALADKGDIAETAAGLEQIMRNLDPAVQTITRRFEAGDYATIEQLRDDWLQLIVSGTRGG